MTRSRLYVCVISLLMVNSVFAGEPKSYPLTCQGSTGYSVTFKANVTEFNIGFQGGQVAGKKQAPRAGECSWDDRGWRKTEPTKLLWKKRMRSETALWFSPDGHMTNASSSQLSIQSLLKTLAKGGQFRVYVYRVGTGANAYMKVTRLVYAR